jgi:hypothetical protein
MATLKIKRPEYCFQYRATGVLRGRWLPSASDPNLGSILTEDGVFSAELKFHSNVTPQPNQECLLNVWVRTMKSDPGLRFQIKGVRTLPDGTPFDPDKYSASDKFSIRGSIAFQADGKIGVQIRSNAKPPQFDPFYVVLKGNLPTDAKRQFWQLWAYREGKTLAMVDGRQIKKPQRRKKSKKDKKKKVKVDYGVTTAS